MATTGLAISLFVWLIVGSLSLLTTAFWIWMIVDCATNEPNEGNDKIVWLLLIILLPFIGSLLYFFVRRPQRPILAQYAGK
ncbi:MAG: PLDc N-terminal domain-containing protein [Planctomycetaceae bacterium]|nr:PLDc N-terminal domain-containing protein [Planctomycetaceae bacterium]